MSYILGPKERKEIYLRMLEDFKADVRYSITSGFCSWLKQLEGVQADINYYPELIAQRPGEFVYGCYWWSIASDSNGREKRIEALKKALKLVNKQL